jgi:hypothetical protein
MWEAFFGFELDGEIHDGLLLSIMETFHVVDLHEEVSYALEPSSSATDFQNIVPIIERKFMANLEDFD